MQPAIAAARLAAETGTMRVGITIYLLPLLNPVAIAEEAASLDIVTGGRFIFGIGLGYREAEDNAFGLRPGERVTKLRAHLDVIKKLWTGEPVDFENNLCKLQGATMALRPLQQPYPPIWVAANNDRAVERAAELGDTWIINPHATLATISRQMGLYRAALERHGKPFPASCPMMREICVAESREAALRAGPPQPGAEVQGVRRLGPAARPAQRRRHDPGVRRSAAGPLHPRRSRRVRRRDPALHQRDRRQHDDLPGHLARDAAGGGLRGLRLLGEQVRPRITG